MRIAVLADCHIDHGHHNGRWAVEAFDNAISETLERDAQIVIFAGDVFHTGKPSSEALLRCAEGFQRLHRANREIVYVTGNHEWQGVKVNQGHRNAVNLLGQLPGVTAITEPRIVECANGDVRLACLPWPSPAHGQPGVTQTEWAHQLADQTPTDGTPTLAVGHAMIGGSQLSSEHKMCAWQPKETVALADVNLPDIWHHTVLGHIHLAQELSDTCGYAGATDCFTFIDENRVGTVQFFDWDWFGGWATQRVECGTTTFATIDWGESPEELPAGSLIRVRVPEGEQTADYDAREITEAGLIHAGFIHPKPTAADDSENADEEEAEELAGLTPSELLDRWADMRDLNITDRKRLSREADRVLGWGNTG